MKELHARCSALGASRGRGAARARAARPPPGVHTRPAASVFISPLILSILSHKQVPPLYTPAASLYSTVYTHTCDTRQIVDHNDHSPHTTTGRGARAAHQCVQNAPCVYDYVS